ncbi:MAG: TIGR03936 family radical SAM-associated protein [Lachnospiraceae bacterium]
MKLRIKFRKFGPVKFIGHLDIMRFFQKAMRRADIDIAYSAGFSPHQIMSFAAPLGVGLESNGEYLDIEMNSAITTVDFIKQFNAVTALGIELLDVRLLPADVGNAMASVAAALYTVTFRRGRAPACHWQASFEDFMKLETIVVTKQTKKSTMELDLKPFIYSYKIEGDSLQLLVDASSSGNIKPGMVVEAFMTYSGEVLQENALCIIREETYGKRTVDEETSFIPLADFGEVMV